MLALKYSEFNFECGTDEAGRGCLAGPVTAAAIILPNSFSNSVLNDSKQLSKKKRHVLKDIIENDAICYGVSHVFEKDIDKLNILNDSILAMHQAIEKLDHKIDFISVDGNKFKPFKSIQHKTIIKGDGKYLSIAAASVLAKTYRDDIMKELDKKHPNYFWKNNKGYPTKQHRKAIAEFGSTKHHRKSFQLLPNQLSLSL